MNPIFLSLQRVHTALPGFWCTTEWRDCGHAPSSTAGAVFKRAKFRGIRGCEPCGHVEIRQDRPPARD
jgi:hypothetical protein